MGQWFAISTIDYSIGEKTVIGYESAYRTTRKHYEVDGVEVVPIIKKGNQKYEMVFIANFRPPAGAFTV